MSYCKIPQAAAAQEGKGNMGNLLTTLWTDGQSVFRQELGLTVNTTTSSPGNMNFRVEEILFLCSGIRALELTIRVTVAT